MKKYDLILAAAVVIAAAFLLIFQFLRQDGEVFGTYGLTEDQTVEIDDTNRLVIKDGEARMEWADCPDQICVDHRAVSRNGESIICLPNQVVVTVASSEESDVDAVAQ